MEVKETIKKMTLNEKISLLCGESFFSSRKLSQYGIKSIQMLDGGTGINFEQLFGDLYREMSVDLGYTPVELDNATRFFFEDSKLSKREIELRDTIFEKLSQRVNGRIISPGCYPPGILLGSTWNEKVVYDVGRALGIEARLYGIDCLLGTPNINLLRDPRNGRFFEGYSEDPLLTGNLGSNLVRGVEEEGVASNVKHFVANNLEINRSGINQIISERALMELYLPAFKKCLSEGAATVMTSYPSINGIACVNNYWLLTRILRENWSFEGVNMTDWGAVTGDSGEAVAAGIDLLMPGPWPMESIIEAVNSGKLTEERIDEACERMIRLSYKYAYTNEKYSYSDEEYLRMSENAGYNAAVEGITMLKNKDNLFPVNEKNNQIILFGSDDIKICGGGSAQVFTDRKLRFSEAFYNLKIADFEEFSSDKNSIAMVVCSLDSTEGSDRESLELDNATKTYLEKLIEIKKAGSAGKIALVLNVPGPVLLSDYIDEIDTVFVVYYPGSYGVKALKDIMFGYKNPSGKLTCTWPSKIEDMPSYLYYPDGFTSYYGEGIFVGYRGYEKTNKVPLFPFGFGLSYTNFEIENIYFSKENYKVSDEVTITYTLKNVGNLEGSEVVQIYVGDPNSLKIKPIKELRAFQKTSLKSGESKVCQVSFRIRHLASYDEDFKKFIVEDGIYDIYVGTSSSNAKKVKSIRVIDGDIEYRLGLDTPIRELMKIPELYSALKSEIQEKGLSEIDLIMNERYTPANSLSKIYANADTLEKFVSMCTLYNKN